MKHKRYRRFAVADTAAMAEVVEVLVRDAGSQLAAARSLKIAQPSLSRLLAGERRELLPGTVRALRRGLGRLPEPARTRALAQFDVALRRPQDRAQLRAWTDWVHERIRRWPFLRVLECQAWCTTRGAGPLFNAFRAWGAARGVDGARIELAIARALEPFLEADDLDSGFEPTDRALSAEALRRYVRLGLEREKILLRAIVAGVVV